MEIEAMIKQQRYKAAPKHLDDIEYLFWCAKKARVASVREAAEKTLKAAMDDQGIIRVWDKDALKMAHEYDSEEQMMLAVHCDIENGSFDVLGAGHWSYDIAMEVEQQAEEARMQAVQEAEEATRSAWVAGNAEARMLLDLACDVVKRCKASGTRIGASFERGSVVPVQTALGLSDQARQCYCYDVCFLLARVLGFDGPNGTRMGDILESRFDRGDFGSSLSLADLRKVGDELRETLKRKAK
jgi:hypothetical protein